MASEAKSTATRQQDHLNARYTGTIHPDTTRHEWITNQHRDTLSSIIGHPSLLSYVSLAEGNSIARQKFELCQKMLQPCGPPPKTDDR